jgi:hypothetical protein
LSTQAPHWLQWWQRGGFSALHFLHVRYPAVCAEDCDDEAAAERGGGEEE